MHRLFVITHHTLFTNLTRNNIEHKSRNLLGESSVKIYKQRNVYRHWSILFILIRNLKSALNYAFCRPYNTLDGCPGLGLPVLFLVRRSVVPLDAPGGCFWTLNVYDYPIAFLWRAWKRDDKNRQMGAEGIDRFACWECESWCRGHFSGQFLYDLKVSMFPICKVLWLKKWER